MRVLGIDPGTIGMGYGVVDDTPKIVADDYGVVALSRTLSIGKTALSTSYPYIEHDPYI
ncbi:MAG: hypothetical protein CM1200mP15_19920 [Dehalococcoidia bacterium]|nr:MAG: hypothetical protein CM1200mP15_19920 [Dehalococcoidia bacterium]